MQANEKQLFKRLETGDEEAFRQLVILLNPLLAFSIRPYLPGDQVLEDILQEVYLVLWHQRTDIAAMEFPVAFLKKCARNMAADYLTRLAKRNAFLMKLKQRQFYEQVDPEHDVKEMHALIQRAIDALPPQRKAVYQLCREENKKYKEVAEILNLSVNTVRNTMENALLSIYDFVKQKVTLLSIMILTAFMQ